MRHQARKICDVVNRGCGGCATYASEEEGLPDDFGEDRLASL